MESNDRDFLPNFEESFAGSVVECLNLAACLFFMT